MLKPISSVVLLFICSFSAALFAASPDADYARSIEAWRTEREAKLKSDTGWLTVAGLFTLEQGVNRAGVDPDARVILPDGSGPREFGTFTLRGEEISFTPAKGVVATLNGDVLGGERMLRTDAGGQTPDLLGFGNLTLFGIKRGDRLFIRMRDTGSKMRREFTGLRWYPIDPKFRVKGKWVAYKEPRKVLIPTVIDGVVEEHSALGTAVFRLGGKECRLEAVREGEELFFIFKDETAGSETYPAGRFLYSAMPRGNEVILDFNKAYTPPCAFTPYATCPLPSKQNRLAVKIPAGELNYAGH